jgi:hypothetical protein
MPSSHPPSTTTRSSSALVTNQQDFQKPQSPSTGRESLLIDSPPPMLMPMPMPITLTHPTPPCPMQECAPMHTQHARPDMTWRQALFRPLLVLLLRQTQPASPYPVTHISSVWGDAMRESPEVGYAGRSVYAYSSRAVND